MQVVRSQLEAWAADALLTSLWIYLIRVSCMISSASAGSRTMRRAVL
jgi:hypothetical protein